MLRRFLHRLTAGLPCRLIDINHQPYMERYYVGTLFGATFYLHRFVAGDGDRHVHDHPWDWSLGLVLVGGYEEERLTGFCTHEGWQQKTRRIRWWRPNLIGRRAFHRITNPKPGTWTLFVHGRRTKGWGFLFSQQEVFGTQQIVEPPALRHRRHPRVVAQRPLRPRRPPAGGLSMPRWPRPMTDYAVVAAYRPEHRLNLSGLDGREKQATWRHIKQHNAPLAQLLKDPALHELREAFGADLLIDPEALE